LSAQPRIINTVNSIPANHVACVVVAAGLNPLLGGVHVVHVTGHPRLTSCINKHPSLLECYGFNIPEVSYDSQKEQLERYALTGGQEKDQEKHALMSLYYFYITNLPATARAPELNNRNSVKTLKADAEDWTGIDESIGYDISRENIGRYLRYLAEIKFVGWPLDKGRALPKVSISIV
jgi:L-aminoadipate-semialdehyde dehydrogenase